MKKPLEENCTYVRRLAPANRHAVYQGIFTRYDVHLSDQVLWLSRELSIPLSTIRTKRIVERGWLIRRVALRIEYEESIRRVLRTIHLCDISFLGFYRRESLDALSEAIDEAIANAPTVTVTVTTAPESPMPAIELPRVTEQINLWQVLGESLGTLGAPDRIRLGYYRQLAASWGISTGGEWTSVDEARVALAERASKKGISYSLDELDRARDTYVKLSRVVAVWNLLWMVGMPLGVVSRWAVQTGASASWPVAAALVVAFFVVLRVSVFVQAVLNRPFAWTLDKCFGSKTMDG